MRQVMAEKDSGSAESSQSKRPIPEEPSDLPELRTPLHLTGNFANWRTDFAPSRLRRVALEKDTLRLRMCLRLTSQSFSFQVVCPTKDWSWRLYPRDAQPIRFTHVSKEGKLVAGNADAVAVAVGDLRAGHGLNFHVLERSGAVVTVWVEVPVVSKDEGTLDIQFESRRARVWYTLEVEGALNLLHKSLHGAKVTAVFSTRAVTEWTSTNTSGWDGQLRRLRPSSSFYKKEWQAGIVTANIPQR
eukprot:s1007_g3.t1